MKRPRLVLVNAIHGKFGGGRIHLQEVLPRLARLGDPEVRYVAVVRPEQEAPLREAGVETRRVAAPRNFALSFLWDQTLLPALAWRLGAGLVFSPANYGPWLLGRRCLLLVRNTMDAAEAWKSWRERLYWRAQEVATRWSVRTARGGLVVSDAFRRTVAARLRVPESWLVVNHHGHATVFDEASQPGDTELVPPGRYLLVVSDLYPHKNVERVLEAYAAVVGERPELSLHVVGAALMPAYAARVRERARSLRLERVTFAGPASQADLAPLYRRAAAVLCLSLAESFGMPQVEAMASGAPLVASDLPVFREISGAAAEYADPTDVPAMAAAIRRVLDDPAHAARLAAAGKRRAAEFTWDRCARAVHAEVRLRLGLPARDHTAGAAGRSPSKSTLTRNA